MPRNDPEEANQKGVTSHKDLVFEYRCVHFQTVGAGENPKSRINFGIFSCETWDLFMAISPSFLHTLQSTVMQTSSI